LHHGRGMKGHAAVAVLAALTSTTTPLAAAESQQSQPWSRVAKAVRARLQEDPALARRHLEVDASGLVLTVSGTVGDEMERRRALEIARANANPHMIVSDGLTLLSTPPVPPSQSRAAQYRFVRNAGPPPPAMRPPPPPPPRPPAPTPRPPPPAPKR
jgi:hypothetical protein